jgi:hypothetical protein
LENARADALSRRQDYLSKLIKKPRVILKKEANRLKYNYEFLAIFAILEDYRLEE